MNDHKDEKRQSAFYYVLAFRIASDMIIATAAPAILAALGGKALDEELQTEPLFFTIFLITAFAITAVYIKHKAVYYGKLYEKGSRNS
jgi:F0F1-type ATP synthase assembly protein I